MLYYFEELRSKIEACSPQEKVLFNLSIKFVKQIFEFEALKDLHNMSLPAMHNGMVSLQLMMNIDFI